MNVIGSVFHPNHACFTARLPRSDSPRNGTNGFIPLTVLHPTEYIIMSIVLYSSLDSRRRDPPVRDVGYEPPDKDTHILSIKSALCLFSTLYALYNVPDAVAALDINSRFDILGKSRDLRERIFTCEYMNGFFDYDNN